MRAISILIPALISGYSMATLPPPSDEAKAQAAQTAAKNAWSDKMAQYQLCVSMDRTAAAYRNSLKATGTPVPTPIETAPCVDPGPYASSTPSAPKPLEASGAHSPPETATAPPSTNRTAAEIAGRKQDRVGMRSGENQAFQ